MRMGNGNLSLPGQLGWGNKQAAWGRCKHLSLVHYTPARAVVPVMTFSVVSPLAQGSGLHEHAYAVIIPGWGKEES